MASMTFDVTKRDVTAYFVQSLTTTKVSLSIDCHATSGIVYSIASIIEFFGMEEGSPWRPPNHVAR